MTSAPDSTNRGALKAHLVGGGIAGLASAAYLIRSGVRGENIQILEEATLLGGSLDGGGSAASGYTLRGGRMVTYEAYTCMFDLLSFIPSLTDDKKTVKGEIYDFNERWVSHSRARLIVQGQKLDASDLGLANKDRLDLIEIMALGETSLGAKRIEEMFQASFFKTNFWFMWSTTFAFQPWHSAAELRRYLHRFIQEFPRIDTLAGVRRTPYNQYDSIVRPLVKWLQEQGVVFTTGITVTDLDFRYGRTGKQVERIHYLERGVEATFAVEPDDLVFVTNGSMTAGSSFGSISAPAKLQADKGGSWTYGRPWRRSTKASDVRRPLTIILTHPSGSPSPSL